LHPSRRIISLKSKFGTVNVPSISKINPRIFLFSFFVSSFVGVIVVAAAEVAVLVVVVISRRGLSSFLEEEEDATERNVFFVKLE
jgi:hypothetical protein